MKDYYRFLTENCVNAGATETIGKTVSGLDIPLVHTGRERADTLIVGSVHAREHITTDLIEKVFFGTEYCFDIIPCLNIDGVILAKYGLDGLNISEERKKFLLSVNGGNDFSLWKANISAVDINVNFDAKWGTGAKNIRYPSSENYIGRYPESEPETRAVTNLIKRNRYAQVICFHSKGEVIYHGFGGIRRYIKEAEEYAESLGYELTKATLSAGGLKDWYDLNFDGLGLTVEVGEDKYSHPYPTEKLPELILKHERSVNILYENGKRIAGKIYGGCP